MEATTLPSSLEAVSEELDELLIRQLELIQDYVNLSRESEVHQKDGYLNLAKSRYIQGSQSISQVRLPTEESEEYDAVITVTKDSENENDQGNKRKMCADSGTNAETKLLRQFGVLSSNSVKTAQKSFRKSVEICIDRINIAEKLFVIQERFNLLHKVKNEFIVTDTES